MAISRTTTHARMLCGAAAAAILAFSGAAQAQEQTPITIAPQSLATALYEFGGQTGRQVLFTPDIAATKTTRGVSGATDQQLALAEILEGTGLTFRQTGETYLIVRADAPQSGSAAGDGAEVEALIVTAQKKEEDIQDVPIAISAFSQKALDELKIEGGFDLLKAIPNVTFSKNNFTSYNFSIRGVGTKAISATTDPGVSVSFNNTGLIQNRLFEQEYFDVERVEVLRGPQGTLYGRNATSGVINVISAKPDMNDFDGWVKGEVGNYHTKRISAMVNMPVVDDVLAVRLAGALTDRQGYDYNEITKNAVNGRDLWSARLTVGFNPTDTIRANLIWERFEEDDNRSRTGKQLCHHDDGPEMVGDTPVAAPNDLISTRMRRALFGQGCKPGSLYDDEAFGTPNGLSLPFVFGMLALQGPCGPTCPNLFSLGREPDGTSATLVKVEDPYGGLMQSRDLRVIASLKDPRYRAKADVFELNLDWELTDALTLSSQTAYVEDSVYSFQDFNRFNTQPIFNDSAKWTKSRITAGNPTGGGPSLFAELAPGGYFCDPQLGCSNTMVGFDISQAQSEQFSQEIRLQSSFDGPINFSLGGNYTEFDVLVDYYVMYNLITAFALGRPFYFADATTGIDMTTCPTSGYLSQGPAVPMDDPTSFCPYIDPNPVESINGEGHNYFRSKNPYKLKSAAVFGELYWEVADAVKVTAGLRYTDDKKTFIPVPSQVLLSSAGPPGGEVSKGYPEKAPIKQHWGEWTGRLGVDWRPGLSFTDETMLYAFYSHGYKGGGANPPSPGFASREYTRQNFKDVIGYSDAELDMLEDLGVIPFLKLTAVEYGPTFEPEFVDAFEIGAKNTLLGGAMTFNAAAFFYDYRDYQVSQIRDRTAVNENFDAQTWGVEFETRFAPSKDFQLIANLGYLDTKIADGETSIDIMNRTQGDPNYTLVKPWVQLPSNCVVPTPVAEEYLQTHFYVASFWEMCGGWTVVSLPTLLDPATGEVYDPAVYPEINGGAGIRDELGGNELPNAPHWTMNVGAQYGFDLLEDWRVTVRGDAYWQSQSWARVYNADPYDKLHGWYNVNLSIWFERPDDDLKIELYAKNLLDKTPITDAFLNSDDTALTTNVFVLDPRLIGLSIKKGF